jgi:two-component system response regulator VicR
MSQGKKVIVVNKGKELTEIAQKAAELSSWELTIATNTKQALELTASESPGIIVLGYLEPQGEAFRLHKQLRENPETGNIPQVVVDVAPDEQLQKGWRKADGLRMDAEHYLCLPINPSELAQAVEDVVALNEAIGVA